LNIEEKSGWVSARRLRGRGSFPQGKRYPRKRGKIDLFSGCLCSPATGFILPSEKAQVQEQAVMPAAKLVQWPEMGLKKLCF